MATRNRGNQFLDRTNLFMFQLMALRVQDGELHITEVERMPLVTRPETISNNFKAGTNIARRRSGFFSDEAGVIAGQIQIQGSTGVKKRRYKGTMVDGFTRMNMFRDRIFRLSHTINKADATKLLSNYRGIVPMDINIANATALGSYVLQRQYLGDDIVYAVNWYDFWNDEKFCVDITTFSIQSTAKQMYNRRYSIAMTVLGAPLEVTSQSLLERTLLAVPTIAHEGSERLLIDDILNISSDILKTTGIGDTYLEPAKKSVNVILSVLPVIVETFTGSSYEDFQLSSQRNYNKVISGLGG